MQISLGIADLLTIIIYLAVIIAVGVWFTRNEKSSEDYLLGGRKQPWFAVGISYMMSLLSTLSIVALPGEVFNHGLSLYALFILYPIFSIFFFYVFMGFYFRLKSFTPFEYLERRYSPGIRLMVSIIYLWTRMFYLAMVLFATSKVFLGGAGWNPIVTILVIGGIGIIYTVAGGMKALIWTDVVQFVVLAGGMGIALYFCITATSGGVTGVFKYTFEQGHGFDDFTKSEFYTFTPYFRLSLWLLLIGSVMQPIMYNSSDQISIQRLLTTSSFNQAKKAIYTNAFISLPFQIVMLFIGMAIFTYYSQHPDPNVTSGDTAFFTFIATKMPTPLPGLMLAAMLAAAMSTINSGLNSLAAVYVKEYQIPYFTPNMDEKKQVFVSRIATCGVGIFAITGAILINLSSDSLGETVVEAMTIWGSLGVIMVPIYLLAVTTKRINTTWIWRLCAIAFGSNTGMIAWYLVSKNGLTGPIQSRVPLCSLIVGVLLCLIGQFLRNSHLPKSARLLRWIGVFVIGMTCTLTFWYLQSNLSAGGGTLSFAWVTIPATVLMLGAGYALLPFLPKNQAKHINGLTLLTVKDNPID